VLITGFGPFPGAPENPSAWLAEALAAKSAVIAGVELHAQVLPTEWRAAALIHDLYAALQPVLTIHFGLNQRAKGFRIERFAHNRAGARPDASGALPPSHVVKHCGAARLATALPVAQLVRHLKTGGAPAVSSSSAGNYLCNFLYYHALEWAEANGRHALFVHIPPVGCGGIFDETALLRGAQEILRFALGAGPKSNKRGGPDVVRAAVTLGAKGA